MKNMRPQIRGTLCGLAFFFGSIGTTTFALAGGEMFDTVGPYAPFMLVGIVDFITFFIACTFICSGLVKHPEERLHKD